MKPMRHGHFETSRSSREFVEIPVDVQLGQYVSYEGVSGEVIRIRGTFNVNAVTGEASLQVEIKPDDAPAFWAPHSELATAAPSAPYNAHSGGG